MIGDVCMSFVICVCGYDFSMMMADGRLVEYPNSNVIVNEKVMKIIKINNNVMVGFTGDPLPAEFAINDLMKYDVQNCYVPEVQKILIEKLKHLKRLQKTIGMLI